MWHLRRQHGFKLQLKQHGKKADGALRKALILNEVLNQDGEVVDPVVAMVSASPWRQKTTTTPGLRQIQADIDGEAEFTVVVTVKFKDTEDLNLCKAQAELATAELEPEMFANVPATPAAAITTNHIHPTCGTHQLEGPHHETRSTLNTHKSTLPAQSAPKEPGMLRVISL